MTVPWLTEERRHIHRDHRPGRVLPAAYLLAITLWAAFSAGVLRAAPSSVTPTPILDVVPPAIPSDEPRAAHFSARRAAEYLDGAAHQWQVTRKCAAFSE